MSSPEQEYPQDTQESSEKELTKSEQKVAKKAHKLQKAQEFLRNNHRQSAEHKERTQRYLDHESEKKSGHVSKSKARGKASRKFRNFINRGGN